MSTSAISAPLTDEEMHQFVNEWYHALDVHAPLETFLSMVANEGIEFRFPEVTVKDKAGLTQWYQRVTNTFFDEIHETQALDIIIEKNFAIVHILTHWQASTWTPPTPKSERLGFLANQTWTVKRSKQNGSPVVVTYLVDSFEPVGNSGALPVKEMPAS